jgi:aspartate carbamoyltransferase catalytic subunit
MIHLKHLTGLKNLSRQDIVDILNVANSLENICSGKEKSSMLSNKLLATFFYEPSTRTRFSFEAAMQRLGGGVLSMADAKTQSSAWKGESIPDTIRTIDNYADVIVIRHSVSGTADTAAMYSRVPVLNAGDGTNEHPTQALLDILTIEKERGTIDGLKVVMVGDLKHTRSTNSLTLGLSNFDVDLTLVSPPGYETSEWILDILRMRNISFRQTNDLKSAVKNADVVYVCRIQKERLEGPEDYEQVKNSYFVNRAILEEAPRIVTVLHHLPRVGELSEDVDEYPGAAYFKQPFNGVLIRAALLALVLKGVV